MAPVKTEHEKISFEDRMETRFETLEKRLVAIMVFGVSAIGVVVMILSIFIASLNSAHNRLNDRLTEQSDKLTAQSSKVQALEQDFGTTLLITPREHQIGYEWIYQELIQKYNPKRGVTTK